MAEETITIEFKGYWRDENKGGLPAESGIYCVYECTHNATKKTVSIQNLVYIGESEDVKSRVANHEKYRDWLKHVRRGNELCFSFGGVAATDRPRAEAAMVYKHRPLEADEYVDSFPFDRTAVSLSGKTRLLSTHFTVSRT